ncbi:MAG: response regulator [Anaerolineales bacterium]
MPKILVIEDMPESADMAAQILRSYGHEVWIADNAHAGLELAAELFPDLIVCDYWLPDQDARAVLRRLRETETLRNIKVVVCTAAPELIMRQTVEDLEFDGYIAKPYRLSNFMQAVEAQLA